MPDQYDWGLWPGRRSFVLPHSYVYRRDVSLQAHTTYHFLTRNLSSGWFGHPDPVMYLVLGNEIVAFNDDFVGYASEIVYTPSVADTYRLVIRAFTTATPGFCDVYQGVGGAAPSLLDSNVMFGGTYVWVRWKLGEWFETGLDALHFTTNGSGGPAGDPYLFLIHPDSAVGSKMFWNDDGAGMFPDSKIVPQSEGTGAVILASFSRYTSGECALALVGQSYKAPWMSPAPWASVAEQPARTPSVTKYLEELRRRKPALKKLSPNERDQEVLELQRRMLPEEEVRRQRPRLSAVSTEFVRRQEILEDRHRELEKELGEMSYDERAATLARVKRETLGREYSEPEGPPHPEEGRDADGGEA